MGGLIGRQDAPSSVMQYRFTAIAGQTVFQGADAHGFTLGYRPGRGNVLVFRNGAMLAPTDFDASNGSSVTLAVGAAANDVIGIVAIGGVTLTDTYRKGDVYNKSETYSQAEARALFGLDQPIFNITGDRQKRGLPVIDVYQAGAFGTSASYTTTGQTPVLGNPTTWQVTPKKDNSRLHCVFQASVGAAANTQLADVSIRIQPAYFDGTAWVALTVYDEAGTLNASGQVTSFLSMSAWTCPSIVPSSQRRSDTGVWHLGVQFWARIAGTTASTYNTRITWMETD